MLFAGELAVRRISKSEITASTRDTKFNFKITSRIQVSNGHRYLAPALPYSCALIFTVVTCRSQHVEHRGFCEEPPRQAWPPGPKSSSWVDNFWCVSVIQPHPSPTI